MKHFDFINLLALPPPLASILPEHAVIVNEANKHILLCPQDGAKVLVNGRTMEEGGKVELHHNDRFAGQGKGTVSVLYISHKSMTVSVLAQLAEIPLHYLVKALLLAAYTSN